MLLTIEASARSNTLTGGLRVEGLQKLEGLTKRYGSSAAVDSLSFDVPAGEVTLSGDTATITLAVWLYVLLTAGAVLFAWRDV